MTDPSDRAPRPSGQAVLRAALIVGGIAALGFLAWQLTHVLLLVFAAVLVAIVLRSLAEQFERFGPIAAPWSVALSGLAIAVVLGGFVALLGAQVQSQITDLADRIPGRIDSLGEQLGVSDLREQITSRMEEAAGSDSLLGRAASYTASIADAATSIVLVVVAGVFMALKPDSHRHGLVILLPPGARERTDSALCKAGRSLKLWLLGQMVSMVFVGVVVAIGLMLLGVPSPLALGLIAGLFGFVPLVGPILATVPAVLIALSQDGLTAVWVVILYVAVQQLDGNILQPIVQRRAVDLPPVLMLFSIVAFGVLFGPLGIVLGTPLAVLVHVLVKQLYLRDGLNEDVSVSGGDDR